MQTLTTHWMSRSCLAGLFVSVSSLAAAWGPHGAVDEDGFPANPRKVVEGQIAPLLEGLGDHHFEVTTDEPLAQVFFNQGLALSYAYNHAESIRSFQQAQLLDPDCAMAYWGEAYALGQNLNQPMPEENITPAWEALQKALARKSNVSGVEQDLIDALAKRYAKSPSADREALNTAYAEAMAGVAARYPAHPDVLTLHGDAIMNTMPWSYWGRDGQPAPGTLEAIDAFDQAIAVEARHPGAHHFRIHILEARDPWRAESSADALVGLMPAAGHMVHMPSHIFVQVGRYQDTYEANKLAIAADESYIAQCRRQGIYPLAYYPHNIHFMYWAAMIQGRSAEAIEASKKIAQQAGEVRAGEDFGLYDTFLALPVYTLVRFGKWDEVFELEASPYESPFYDGMLHYARGMAYAHTGQSRKARSEQRALDKVRERDGLDAVFIGFTPVSELLAIATDVLAGEIASRQGKHDDAIAYLDRAVRMQDRLTYNEPPDWYYPVRHTLGAALLAAGRAEEAEQVYWDDLRRFPENGWALYGMQQALEAQGRDDEAAAMAARFQASWTYADIQLTSSRF